MAFRELTKLYDSIIGEKCSIDARDMRITRAVHLETDSKKIVFKYKTKIRSVISITKEIEGSKSKNIKRFEETIDKDSYKSIFIEEGNTLKCYQLTIFTLDQLDRAKIEMGSSKHQTQLYEYIGLLFASISIPSKDAMSRANQAKLKNIKKKLT